MGNGIIGNWSSVTAVTSSGDNRIDALVGGRYQWSTDGSLKTIYYSFPGSTASYDPNYTTKMEFKNYKALTSAQQTQVTAALATWEAVANIDFVLVSDNSSQAGDIRLAMSTNMDAAAEAYAYQPSTSACGGDVWLNSKYYNGDSISAGSYTYMSVIHEVGHALGLKHPGNYNALGGGTSGPYLSTAEDKYAYSIMSYNHGSDFSQSIKLTGPSIYDIKAIQYLYGANMSAGAGDNTYKMDSTAFTTIWDPNGSNRIDGSASSGTEVIDLREGGFSYIGSNMCLAVAYGTKMSSALTGTGAATVYCNDSGNSITLTGSTNTVYGGSGNDTVTLAGKSSDYTVTTSGSTTILTSSKGKTTLSGIENIVYAGGSETTTTTTTTTTNVTKLIPTYVASSGDTGIYRIALSSFGVTSVSSITIYDDNFISGGTAGASGLDLDFIKVSSTASSSASTISRLSDEANFSFTSSAVDFSKGYMTKWNSSVDSSAWNTSRLFGTNADGTINFSNATLGTLDGSNGTSYGEVSLGEGGKITFKFSSAFDPTGKYLYFGDVGGSNDGCYVSVGSSTDSPTGTVAGLTLQGTDEDDDLRLGVGVNAGMGAGNDTIIGGGGDDVIDGGAGFNTAVFTGNSTSYSINRSGSTITVSGLDGTDTLTNIQRLSFDDRDIVGSLPSFQTNSGSLATTISGKSLSISQVTIDDTEDDVRGTLSSKVQVNGVDVTGVNATLKKGWKVATTLDVAGTGATQLFFFGVDTVAGVGSGYGATWSLNSSGAVTSTAVQIQMKKQGWEVAGAANVNGSAGDEVLWQNTVTGDKALWTDTDHNGVMDLGVVLSGLGQDTQTRIVGVSDLDRDGKKEFMLFNDSTSALNLYEATPSTSVTGSVDTSLLQSYSSFSAFQSAVTAAGASYSVFGIVG